MRLKARTPGNKTKEGWPAVKSASNPGAFAASEDTDVQRLLLPEPNREHPHWKEGQINGVRYYIIPVQNDAVK